MSTEIKPATGRNDRFNSSRKAELLNKIEGIPDDINFAIFIDENEGIISVSEDKTIRVWLKRDSGTYWPSIVNFMPSQCSSLEYIPETRTLFVGQENGTISQFLLSEDCNRLSPIKEYLAHNGRITQLIFAKNSGWILSCARDKTFAAHCIETSNKIGGYTFEAWCTSMQFDSLSKHVFVGDYAGQITMLKLQQSGASLVTILKGHTASVRSLHWSDGPQLLFSGSADNSVIVWDLGGRRGTTYELQGHQNKVSALGYVKSTQELISAGEDSVVVLWKINCMRKAAPDWIESDTCQLCAKPFFWNIKAMFEQKALGVNRQHHCRNCGKAICDKCSPNRINIPIMGFEYDVRVCNNCYTALKDTDRPSLATFLDVKHSVVAIDVDEEKKRILTVGQDRIIKIWDLSNLW